MNDLNAEILNEQNPHNGQRRLLSYWPDAVLVLVAVALALPTLAYPLFRDQAHHYYVGRWWLEGMQPYRDAFDVKPPLIFALHAAGHAMFGLQQWWIRLMDLLAVLAIATMAAFLASRQRQRPACPGEIGGVVLVGVAMYYGPFEYGSTAQTETFLCLALMLGWTLLRRVRNLTRAAWLTGICSSVAVFFKPTALLPAAGIGALLLMRAWRETPAPHLKRAAAIAGWHLIGGSAVAAAFLGWLALHGALGSMMEAMGPYAMHYARHSGLTEQGAWTRIGYFFFTRAGCWPWIGAAFAGSGLVATARRRDRACLQDALEATLLFALSVATVILQGRYFVYHWVAVFPFAIVLVGTGISAAARLVPRAAFLIGPIVAAAGLALHGDHDYAGYWRFWLHYARGQMSHTAFLGFFNGNWNFSARDSAVLAEYVRQTAKPGDLLLHVGREPNINVLSDLKAPTQHPAWAPAMSTYRGGIWLQEREACIRERKVRFVVVPTGYPPMIESMSRLGYRTVRVVNQLTLLDRDAAHAESEHTLL